MIHFINEMGNRYGTITVLRKAPSQTDFKTGKSVDTRWDCVCDCGREMTLTRRKLHSNPLQLCECHKDEWKAYLNQDPIGKRFGRLTVLGYLPKSKKGEMLDCLCDCGTRKPIRKHSVISGHSQSCGCKWEETKTSSDSNKSHGKYRDRLYSVWHGMRQRCSNPKEREYHNYGKRGITVCEEWNYFEPFREWAYANGYNPDRANKHDCMLDRIDVNKGYSPDNCRWITNLEQQNNRQYHLRFTHNGETHTCSEWARILNVPYSTLRQACHLYGKTIQEFLDNYTPRNTA